MLAYLRHACREIWDGLIFAIRHPVRSATTVIDELGRALDH